MGSYSCRRGMPAASMRVILFSLVWASLCLRSSGCLQEEKAALLEIKASLLRSNLTPPPTWVEGSDCCSWRGVECSNASRRVWGLHLGYFALYDATPPFPSWHLNFSIFKSFHTLRHLDLSSNNIGGPLASQDFTGLRRLTYLDLSDNEFTGGIQTSLTNLTSLRVLYLEYNLLSGSFPVEVFNGLQQLRELHLQSNQLRGSIPQHAFSSLTSLHHLDLSDNHFDGNFPLPSLANLSKLEEIDVSGNSRLGVETNFQHSILTFQLRVLALSNCNLTKNFLADATFLSSQYRLLEIDLSSNNLSGSIPDWFLKNCTQLEYVSLRNNSLIGEIHLPTRPISSMQAIDLSMNNFDGQLPPNFGMIFPNLQNLNLSMNHLSGNIPTSFVNMSELETIDLSNNHFSGRIPPIQGSRLFTYLKLSNNCLQGEIPSILPPISYLDGNKLTGTIPSNLSIGRPDAFYELLDVHDNQLSGKLPESIGEIPGLTFLILGGNRFHGDVPPHLCDLKELRILDLSHNNFSGPIPSCSYPLRLIYLNLARNAFRGSIPRSFTNTSTLLSLNVRNNQLSGGLPSWFGDLLEIRILLLSHNHFEDSIPTHLCKLRQLQVLDLSNNNFSGRIPPCLSLNMGTENTTEEEFPGAHFWNRMSRNLNFQASYTREPESPSLRNGQISVPLGSDLQGVEFSTKGNTYTYKGDILSWMFEIDLSSNRLTGDIPLEIGNLTMVKALNFSHNELTGAIPVTFLNLKEIESLDLSHNHLSGTIPRELGNLKSLEVFSVAYNILSGCTPEFKGQFATFNVQSYEGNMGLRGPPLDESCFSNPSPHHVSSVEEEEVRNNMDDIIFYAISTTSFVVFFWVAVVMLHFNQIGRRVCFYITEWVEDWTALWFLMLAKKLNYTRR